MWRNFLRSRTAAFILLAFVEVMLFNLFWSMGTTFRCFANWLTYGNGLLLAMLVTLPWMIVRRGWVEGLMLLLLDCLLISNLMYCRTYMAAIPLESYALVGNLADFKASVWDSVRWCDFTLPLLTLVFVPLISRSARLDTAIGWRAWASVFVVVMLASGVTTLAQGGFMAHNERMRDSAYFSTVATPVYTVPGGLIYDALRTDADITAEQEAALAQWIADKEALRPYKALPDTLPQRRSIVLILLESFESWLLETEVEGQELTPNLNRLLRDSTTLYARNVLTQVGSGRSIEAQLMINAGLLPMQQSVYSMKYPFVDYPTLIKAHAAAHPDARSYLLSPDKPYVWNQAVIARSFGIDTLLMEDVWSAKIHIGTGKGKISDGELCEQIVEKMQSGQVWPNGQPAFVQIVTFSGHNPFKLPDELKGVAFSDVVPQRMNDYITMANYTDRSLGLLLEYLRGREDYDSTLVVITGDHEGLASSRGDLLATETGRAYVDSLQLTPLIILNSPVAGRYLPIMGQIDIYPTLLNLMHLDDYPWKGVGQSIFDPDKAPLAISTMTGRIEGELENVNEPLLTNIKHSRAMGDLMIKHSRLPK